MARRNWLDVAILPLRWVERTQGWRRTALLTAYLVVGLGVVVPLIREASLWRIPNIAEPVDRAKYGHVDLPDAQNAAILYREAADLLRPKRPEYTQAQAVGGWGTIPTWSRAAPEVQAWVEANAPALERWLAGTKRPDALFRQPIEFGVRPERPTDQEIRALIFLGMMAASRREESDDLAGAWPYRLGVIRTTAHHQRHSSAGEAMFSATILKQAATQARNWVDDDRQTADLLRRAGRDLTAARALLPTMGDLLRAGYFEAEQEVAELADRLGQQPIRPDEGTDSILWMQGLNAVGRLLGNEPRRSLRIFRLLTAGQLAQVDRPELERAPLISGGMIYEVDDHTPAPLRGIRPEALGALVDSSACRAYFDRQAFYLAPIRAGRAALDDLIQHTAARTYALDHGGQAPATFGDLVPSYLDALPEGFKAGDPVLTP